MKLVKYSLLLVLSIGATGAHGGAYERQTPAKLSHITSAKNEILTKIDQAKKEILSKLEDISKKAKGE